jgi:hypothetical protein
MYETHMCIGSSSWEILKAGMVQTIKGMAMGWLAGVRFQAHDGIILLLHNQSGTGSNCYQVDGTTHQDLYLGRSRL